MPDKKAAIGIDLGTTYSCVGVFNDGGVTIIANEQGHRITPSIVAFTDDERLVGDAAEAQATVNPNNTIFEVKRLIGRKFPDQILYEDVKQWPFQVIDDKGTPKINVKYTHQSKIFVPEQISGMVLEKMKKTAEDYLGHTVDEAVITVPAYFSDSQRQATKDAGEIAGLKVLKIINEPTAAALAYGFDKKIKSKQNILVFDMGGGTFDVVVLSIENNNFEVKAVGGDTHLGGSDFDNLMVQHLLQMIRNKYNKDLSTDVKALSRLKIECKRAKQVLSSSLRANVDIACLFDGRNFQTTISRFKFENMCSDLFEKALTHVNTVLQEASLEKHHINQVVLVGGWTRIPKIQTMLQEYFNRTDLSKSVNPDEAVAYGAAIQGAMLSDENTIEELYLADVIPLSLSVANPDGTVTVVLKRNTKTPCKHTVNRTTTHDYQTRVKFRIYEGERALYENNKLLGNFYLENIEYGKKRVPSFRLTYEVDKNGILHISAFDKKTKSANGITITSNKGRLNKADIERMLVEAEDINERDRQYQHKVNVRNELEQYCHDQIRAVNFVNSGGKINSNDRARVVKACNEILEWLEDNEHAELEQYQSKLSELKLVCSLIVNKLN